MRTRRWLTWVIFAVCALAVLEGLGWITWKALRLERAEREASALAQFQESIRLALWRMESEITPILAQEAARPYFEYQAFYPAERAYTRMLQTCSPGEVMVPSPLLEGCGAYRRIHYQVGPDGQISSPQAPTGNLRDLAESQYVDAEYIVLAGERLNQIADLVHAPHPGVPQLGALINKPSPAPPPASVEAPPRSAVTPQPAPQSGATSQPTPQQTFDDSQFRGMPAQVAEQVQSQSLASQKEYAARQQAAQVVNTPENRRGGGKNNTEFAKNIARKDGAATENLADEKQVAKAAPPQSGPAPVAAAVEGLAKDDESSRTLAYKKEEQSGEAARVPPAPGAVPVAPTTALVLPPADRSVSNEVKLLSAQPGSAVPLRAESPFSLRLETRSPIAPAQEVELGALEPVWNTSPGTGSPELVLRRAVTVGGARLEQGVWMDWPALAARLQGIARDLLPGAALEPVVASSSPVPTGQMLASIPVLLRPGNPPPPVPEAVLSSAHMTLGMTWLAVLGGVISIGFVLRTSMELSDRRGRFVSAVTHELRTPLTTFRLYTGMLAGGMVRDEQARRDYLSTLEAESGRLAGIVENVLDYARLGGARAKRNGPIAAADLLAQITPSLASAAGRCGMELVVEGRPPHGIGLEADAATVERILLNLVDNACKYARESGDRRIHLSVRLSERPLRRRSLELSVRDHGPGIPRRERSRVFKAFHRARRDAQGPQSGLGLGLALSRSLARELGGELDLGRTAVGAEIRLTLPVLEQKP